MAISSSGRLKALCDYVEATGDFAFLDETIAWRRADNFDKTQHAEPVTAMSTS